MTVQVPDDASVGSTLWVQGGLMFPTPWRWYCEDAVPICIVSGSGSGRDVCFIGNDCNTNSTEDGAELCADPCNLDRDVDGILDFCETPVVVYVDATAGSSGDGTTWATAFEYVQDGIGSAEANQHVGIAEVWVAAGTYLPDDGASVTSGDRDASFTISGVSIYGGFDGTESTRSARDPSSNVTILSGNIDSGIQDSRHVVTMNGCAVLDGFTIEDARGGSCGGGVVVAQGLNYLTQCLVRGNDAALGGGLCTGGNGTAVVRDCVFMDNSADEAGAVRNISTMPSTFVSCTFLNNIADNRGGAVQNESSDNVFVNCGFFGNAVTGSTGDGGAVYDDDGDTTFTNCVFSGNMAARHGGAIYNRTSDQTITNCTFSNNAADSDDNNTGDGGGISSLSSSSTIIVRNSVVWENVDRGAGTTESAQIHDGSPTVTYSVVEGLSTLGGTNIDSDPLFVDIDGLDEELGTVDDNTRLGPGSAAIDAGQTTAIPADLTDVDVDGNVTEELPMDFDRLPRRVNDFTTIDTGITTQPIVDMGAYEYQRECDDGCRCCDEDGNDVLDDICVQCNDCIDTGAGTQCQTHTRELAADVGGHYGACECDGFCNIHDRNLVSLCFAGTTSCKDINIDAGGAFGSCAPDGFCGVHDTNHVNDCFDEPYGCSATCSPSPSPEFPVVPDIVGSVRLAVVVDDAAVVAGETVVIHVFLVDAATAFQSYQLELHVSGGASGGVHVVDARILDRPDFVFGERKDTFSAFDITGGRMFAGIADGIVDTAPNAYLATFTLATTVDAAGMFVADLIQDNVIGTVLISDMYDTYDITSVTPALLKASLPDE